MKKSVVLESLLKEASKALTGFPFDGHCYNTFGESSTVLLSLQALTFSLFGPSSYEYKLIESHYLSLRGQEFVGPLQAVSL